MRAARLHGKNNLKVDQVKPKDLESNEVKVKVGWAGICGSDLHFYHSGTQDAEMSTPVQEPYILGHEYSGVVEEVGENVSKVKVGDKVAINPLVYNEQKEGYSKVIHSDQFYGSGSHDGGFADYNIVGEDHLYKLYEDTTLEEGALVEPTAVALQAIRESQMEFGDSVAIYGAGPIGLSIVSAAKAVGARDIFVFDLSNERLEIAKELGATHVINSGEQDPVEFIKKYHEEGVKRTFEVAGVSQTFNQAIETTKPRGMMTVVAAHSEPIEFNPASIMTNGIKMSSSIFYEKDIFSLAVNMIESGQIDPSPMITDRIELEDIVEDGFDELSNNKEQTKILVKLNGEVN